MPRKNNSPSGFTLMELLLAVSIFSVIALCLYSAFSGGVRIWRKQEEGFVYGHGTRLALGKMAKELRGSIKYSISEKPEGLSELEKTLRLTGEKEKLSFMTMIDGDIARVSYVFDREASGRGTLRRKAVFQKDGFKEDSAVGAALITGLEGLAFEYAYAGEDEDSPPQWQDSWGADYDANEKKDAGIPAAVRVTLEFKKGVKAGGGNEIFRKTIFIPTGTLEKKEGI